MHIPWEGLAHLQNFFQLNFLFSGLEVSSLAMFIARTTVFILFGAGLLYVGFRVAIKCLECLQTLLTSLGTLPKSFFLLLILVIPLSTESLGAKWIGYILLVLCLLGTAVSGLLALVAWKYGVDQALRLLSFFRRQMEVPQPSEPEARGPLENREGPSAVPYPAGSTLQPSS